MARGTRGTRLPRVQLHAFHFSKSGNPNRPPRLPPYHQHYIASHIMDGFQLRDEAAQDRVRAATEFLDPSKSIELCVVLP